MIIRSANGRQNRSRKPQSGAVSISATGISDTRKRSRVRASASMRPDMVKPLAMSETLAMEHLLREREVILGGAATGVDLDDGCPLPAALADFG